MSNPVARASVEKSLVDVCKLAKIEDFQQDLVFSLQIRRLDHICHVQDRELQAIGLSQPQIRDFRKAASEVQDRINRNNTRSELVCLKNENLIQSNSADLNKVIIPKEQIKLMETIGEGTFSVVKRALWYHPSGVKKDVAVKILRDISPSLVEDLQVEASHLLKLQHSNLIRMYGIVQQPAMMVFELCEGGELLNRLRDTNKPPPLVTTLLDYCLQIVKALTFLESKHFVHRDVAARNILLIKDEKVVKLCDFGLMRNLKENERTYIMHAQKRVPFSWCPPESLRHRKFSHASDVWAFGVTVWEIFSYGEDPWIGCRAIDVLKRLDAGDRLEKPRYCSQQIYDLISLCWNVNPDLRPKFSLLKTLLLGVEFNIAEVRDESRSDSNENMLQMSAGDRVIVIESSGLLWYGQNEKTRKFGSFLRSSVFVHSKSVTLGREPFVPSGNSRISLPIRGSFIHAGHGDVLGKESWGTPERIDDLYLRNPVLGDPLDVTMMGIPAMVSSVAELSSSPGVPLHGVLCTSSKAKAKVDLDDSFDAAAFDENFSPSKIELPDLTTWGQAPSSSRLIIEQTQPGTSQFSRAPVSVLGPLQGAGADQNRALTQTSGKPAAVDPSLIPSVPGQDVLRELTAKVADRNESGVVRLRPQQSLHFIPNAGPRPVGSDPFEISTSVVNAVRRERYNDILEKKSVASRPHSSILPTSAPISIFGNAIHQRSDSANAAVTANTRTQQPVISGESSTNGHNYRSIFSVADKPAPSAQLIDKKGREHEDVMLPSPSHVCSSAQVTEKAVAAPSSSAMGRVTSNGSANSHNHVKLPNSASDESRKKRVEIAISSALPPPSKLFFGNSHGSTSQLTKSSGHGTTTESSVRSNILPSSPTGHSELTVNGVLKPIRLPAGVCASQAASATATQQLAQTFQQIPRVINPTSANGVLRPPSQTQLPLFSLSSNQPTFSYLPNYQYGLSTPWLYNTYGFRNAPQPSQTQNINQVLPPRLGPCAPLRIAEGEDVLEILDPLSTTSRSERSTSVAPATSSDSAPISRAEQMEILYSEAPFADRSRCDQMVAKCRGDITSALRELKIEHLLDTQIARSRERAREALDSRSWDLNAAAEWLITSSW